MSDKCTVCFMNDSFPPVIDGVANAVVNYAKYYQKNFGNAVAAVPYHPEANDDNFAFPVIRYRSYDTTDIVGYRAGYPFSVESMNKLKSLNIDLIHSHCPFMSTFLARTLRESKYAPIVFTYHTKFDIDIKKTIPTKVLQKQAVKIMLNNICACDEVWAVSRGAGENLRSLGFQGDYIVMNNGVDYPIGRVEDSIVKSLIKNYNLPDKVPVYLFVGRMMWYKGLRLVFNSLCRICSEGRDFRMILIGDGSDREAMEHYAKEIGIEEKCIFLGAIINRETLRAWYCCADLFLFLSVYDTNGLVVREAAACGLASVLIKESSAAEDICDGKNGFLCEGNEENLASLLIELSDKHNLVESVGKNAMEQLYLSWEDSVAKAASRYNNIIEKAKTGELEYQRKLSDEIFYNTKNLMDGIGKLRELRKKLIPYLSDNNPTK